MNIGLLVTELEDIHVKDICTGAALAAKEKDIKLIIIPGNYLDGDNKTSRSPYSYQSAAMFDYCVSAFFDAVIIDVDRIGQGSTILKREALLNKFESIPVITLSKHEDYLSVNIPDAVEMSPGQLGYEAVCDAYFYVKNGKLPAFEEPVKIPKEEINDAFAMSVISRISETIFKRSYDNGLSFGSLFEIVNDSGMSDFGVMLFDKHIRNTVKYPWVVPDTIRSKMMYIDGKDIQEEKEEKIISTRDIFKVLDKSRNNAFILGDLYVDEYQLGIVFSNFIPVMLSDDFFNTLTGIVTGIARLSLLERNLAQTSKELLEVQEELARDGSVLDHIGDQDYLTGGLNRRGFFAKAYDLLKEKYTPGKYAIVAYIHMESLKRINEIFGHEEGDRAVKMVAEILDDVFGNCVFGRIRGDEFAVITIEDEDGRAESLREEMADQNNRLLAKSSRYINRLQYSICEFAYEEDFSLRQMLKETDENLQRLKKKGL